MWDVLSYVFGIPFAVAGSLLLLIFKPFSKKLLGRDRGRAYVEGSEVNIGKFTGVGIYFIAVFYVAVNSFVGLGLWGRIVMMLLLASCIFGFLDDRSISPWKEFVKGMIDIGISVTAATFIPFMTGCYVVAPTGSYIHIFYFLFMPLAAILFIVSINATNATDGVDGLSGTLTIITTLTLIVAAALRGTLTAPLCLLGLLMIAVLGPYLCFNYHPSKVLMGDAGSRGIGFFIAMYAILLKIPFAYLIVGLPFLLDGGLSILKITIGRMTHKKVIILPNIITPIHDHLKKKMGFSIWKTFFTITGAAVVIDVAYLMVLFIIKLLA